MERIASYDYDNDILYVNKGEKAQDSLQMDDLVIDFSDHDVVGLEILNASKVISNLLGHRVWKKDLDHLEDAKLEVRKQREVVYLLLSFVLKQEKESVEEHVNVALPAKVSAA